MGITVSITPSRFIASNGKMDSQNRYIAKATPPDGKFVFPVGETIAIPDNGIRYSIAGYVQQIGTASAFDASFHWIAD